MIQCSMDWIIGKLSHWNIFIMPDIFVSKNSQPPVNVLLKDKMSKSFNKGVKNTNSALRQILSSYMFMPEGMRFETQEPGESIILLLRKHWITNLGWVLISIFLIIAPLFLFPGLTLSGIIPQRITFSIASFVVLIWYMLTFSYIYVNFLIWYFTVSIITDERVIDVDFVNLLNKKFAETRISRVEDVTARTGGFIKAYFDYGDVFLQTAAKEAVFQFMEIPRPDEVVTVINQLMGKSEEQDGV